MTKVRKEALSSRHRSAFPYFRGRWNFNTILNFLFGHGPPPRRAPPLHPAATAQRDCLTAHAGSSRSHPLRNQHAAVSRLSRSLSHEPTQGQDPGDSCRTRIDCIARLHRSTASSLATSFLLLGPIRFCSRPDQKSPALLTSPREVAKLWHAVHRLNFGPKRHRPSRRPHHSA